MWKEDDSRVAFKSRDFLFREIYVGSTIELIWMSARSLVLKCISITNTNSKEINVTKYEYDST